MIVAVSWCWAWLPAIKSNTISYGLVQFVQEIKQVLFHHLGQAVASLGKLLGSLKLVFFKHKNYEEVVRDFNASLGEVPHLSFSCPKKIVVKAFFLFMVRLVGKIWQSSHL